MSVDVQDEDMFFELQTKGNIVNVKTEKQKHRLEVLEAKIAKVRKRVLIAAGKRRDLGGKAMGNSRAALLSSTDVKDAHPRTGVQATKENAITTNKVTRVLEQRLNRLRQREDQVGEDSAQERRDIDNLRRRRMQQDLIFDQVTTALKNQEASMALTMQQSNDLYKDLEDMESEKEKMRLQDEDEIRDHEDSIADLKREIFEAKREAAERREAAVIAHINKQAGKTKDGVTLGDLDNDEEDDVKRRIRIATKEIEEETERISAMDKKIAPLANAFNLLMHDTKVYDINGLIDRLLTEEREIYSHFSYLQHMNRDITNAEQKLMDVRRQMDEFKDDQERTVTDHKVRRIKLETERDRIAEVNKEFQKRREVAEEITVELLKRVKQIYVAIGCRPEGEQTIIDKETGAPVDDWDPVGDGLTEDNVRRYLGAIEQRVSEIVQRYVKVLRFSAMSTGQAPLPPTLGAPSPGPDGTFSRSARRSDSGSFRGGKKPIATFSVADVDEIADTLTRGPASEFVPKRVVGRNMELPVTVAYASAEEAKEGPSSPEKPLTSHALAEAVLNDLATQAIPLERPRPPKASSSGTGGGGGGLRKGPSFSGGGRARTATGSKPPRDRAGSSSMTPGEAGSRPRTTGAGGTNKMGETTAW